jgi:hypothetical protein
MVLISLSFSLLALVAGMYLLDKTRKEGLGKFFGFISWFVISLALLVAVCTLAQACYIHFGHHRERPMICYPGMEGCGDMMEDEHCGGMMKGDKKDKCCDWEEEEASGDGMEKEIHKEMEMDTVRK